MILINPFQQVCDYYPTHGGINFSNCILNFFLELCNTLRSVLIDNILEITPQKKSKGLKSEVSGGRLQILSLKNSVKKGHCVFCHVWSRIILLKNTIKVHPHYAAWHTAAKCSKAERQKLRHATNICGRCVGLAAACRSMLRGLKI